MSELSIKLQGRPEKVQRIADALDEAFPGMVAWVLSKDGPAGYFIKIEGFEVSSMPMRGSESKAAPANSIYAKPQWAKQMLSFRRCEILQNNDLLQNAEVVDYLGTGRPNDAGLVAWTTFSGLRRSCGVRLPPIVLKKAGLAVLPPQVITLATILTSPRNSLPVTI